MPDPKSGFLDGPASTTVAVGDFMIDLREPPISSCRRLLEEIAALDLEAIVGPLSAVMSFAGKTDGHAWMLELAPQIVPVAKRVLGHQFGAAVLGAAIAVLDVRRTHRAFVNAGVIPADSRIDLDDDDGFVGCPAVRAFIREEITTVQAVDVVVKAISMANLIGAAGNLLGVFLATAKEAPESSSRKS